MALQTGAPGHFTIPTAPAAGTSCTSGAANVFTTTYVQLIASTAAAIFITGIYLEAAAVSAATYIVVQLATGAGGSETVVDQCLIVMDTGSTVARGYKPIIPPIAVPNGTRIACKTADSVGSQANLITLECINQANVVDAGIAEGVNVTKWNGTTVSTPATAGIPDINVKNINNVAAATPGASGGGLISGSNSGTTTLGALTVTGATTLTGNVVLSDGLTISAPSTLNRAGITITGNGTGAAINGTGGATGQGILIAGGGTSGDGIKVTTTSGHGINLAPVGTSMHGIFSTGGNGGTSDGIKAVAGTGGVDIRGNITGNLVGTVSTLTTYTGDTPQTGDSFVIVKAGGTGDNAAIKAKTDNLPASPASTTNITAGTITTTTNLTTNNDKTGYALSSAEENAIADALLDRANGIETGWTLRQFARIVFSALAGKASGMSGTTAVFRDVGDSKNRISATVDQYGDRSAVTLDAT